MEASRKGGRKGGGIGGGTEARRCGMEVRTCLVRRPVCSGVQVRMRCPSWSSIYPRVTKLDGVAVRAKLGRIETVDLFACLLCR